MTAVTALRMTRATWYKHRFSVVGIPAVFLLAALRYSPTASCSGTGSACIT